MEKVDDQKRAKIAYGRARGRGKEEDKTLPPREVGADGLKGWWEESFTKILDHLKPEASGFRNLLFFRARFHICLSFLWFRKEISRTSSPCVTGDEKKKKSYRQLSAIAADSLLAMGVGGW